jgi:hypothetical protein
MTTMEPEQILARHARAAERRRPLEATWQACYDHALPAHGAAPLFDATAADAAEQLAASLLAELAPPWSRWFALAPARGMQDTAEQALAAAQRARADAEEHSRRLRVEADQESEAVIPEPRQRPTQRADSSLDERCKGARRHLDGWGVRRRCHRRSRVLERTLRSLPCIQQRSGRTLQSG